MQYLALVFSLLLGRMACAQEAPYHFSPLPLEAGTHRVVYAALVPTPATSAPELLARAHTWLATAKPAYHITAIHHPTATNSVRTHVTIKRGPEHYVAYLSVHVRDGAYQYRLDRITYTRPGYARTGKHSPRVVTTPIENIVYTRPSRYRTRKLADVGTHVQQVLDDLQRTMQPPPTLLVRQ